MFKRHGAVIIGLLGVTAILAVSLGYYAFVVRLPDPRTAGRVGLFRWLVQRDVSAEPREVQIALVDRLQAELKSGLADGSPDVPLTAAYRRRLQENAAYLQRVWFSVRVEQYAELEPSEQMPFLEEQIDAIAHWSALDLSAGESTTPDPAAGSQATAFFGQIESWIEQAGPADRTRMIAAVQDGIVCWLATRELSDQPPVVRLELARRIVRELNAGMRLDEILIDLTPPQREKLFANGELLFEVWLHDQAGEFAALPEAQRANFADARIDEVFKWGVLEVLSAPAEGAAPAQPSAATKLSGLARFMALVDGWIERSPPADRANLVRLVAQVQRQLLWRQFRPK